MGKWRWVMTVSLIVAVAAIFPAGCKRRSAAEKEKMAALAGTWEWRQEGSPKPTIVVLELTAKGQYSKATYQEIGGQRKVLYEHKFRRDDIRPEPDDAAQIAALKEQGFGPSVDKGRYRLSFGPKENRILFKSDTLSRAETVEGIGVLEQTIDLRSDKEIVIKGRTYSRATPPAAP